MPIYEYECGNCHRRFEVKQGFHDKPEAKCPQCQETARRVFHPAPIIFKGSGFYVTDHRPPAKEPAPEKSKKESESGKSKSESAPSTGQ
jgi:putative FmdB family regulatory protein